MSEKENKEAALRDLLRNHPGISIKDCNVILRKDFPTGSSGPAYARIKQEVAEEVASESTEAVLPEKAEAQCVDVEVSTGLEEAISEEQTPVREEPVLESEVAEGEVELRAEEPFLESEVADGEVELRVEEPEPQIPEPEPEETRNFYPVDIRVRIPHAETVHLTGDFNRWKLNECEMQRGENFHWVYQQQLPEGEHHFKFLVNGREWFIDFGRVRVMDKTGVSHPLVVSCEGARSEAGPAVDASPKDDVLLAALGGKRRKEVLALLIGRYGGMVVALCRLYLKEEGEAQKAAAAVFLELIVSQESRKKPSSCLAGELFASAFRSANRLKDMLESEGGNLPGASRVAGAGSETHKEQDAIVAQLPEELRTALVLRDVLGHPPDLCAGISGMTEEHFRVDYEKAHARMRRTLGSRGRAYDPSNSLQKGESLPPGLDEAILLSADDIDKAKARFAPSSAEGLARALAKERKPKGGKKKWAAIALAGLLVLLPLAWMSLTWESEPQGKVVGRTRTAPEESSVRHTRRAHLGLPAQMENPSPAPSVQMPLSPPTSPQGVVVRVHSVQAGALPQDGPAGEAKNKDGASLGKTGLDLPNAAAAPAESADSAAPGGTFSLRAALVDERGRSLTGFEVSIVSADAGTYLHARSDDYGSLIFSRLKEGRYRLESESTTHVFPFLAEIRLNAANPLAELGEIIVRRAASISGKVLAEDDRPLEGLQVLCKKQGGGSEQLSEMTSAQGTFVFDRLEKGAFYDLFFNPDKHLGYRGDDMKGLEADDLDLQVRLERIQGQVSISGRVENRAGHGLSRAMILVRSASTTAVTRSDEDGRFTIEHVMPEEAVLGIFHKDYAPLVREVDLSTLDQPGFSMGVGVELLGHVSQQELGFLADVHLSLSSALLKRLAPETLFREDEDHLEEFSLLEPTALSGPSGRFSMSRVPLGTWILKAKSYRRALQNNEDSPDEIEIETEISVREGMAEVELRFPPAGSAVIQGTVFGSFDQGLMLLEWERGDVHFRASRIFRPNTPFLVERLREGKYKLSWSDAKKKLEATRKVYLAEGENLLLELALP
ncbi:MAG: hypothetical protein HQL31_08045 [Planctomycetes bacterium]|nr:hypothetical protein [Planctomycetota bacterium]